MTPARPRLLFFRWTRAGLPDFLQAQLDEQVATLQRWFEVVVTDASGDYDAICDTVRPDLCVFESGVYSAERRLTRTSAHPSIPKLGFLHADAFDSSRAAAVAELGEWGVESFVTTSMAMAEYTPEIADRLFVWPNAIDAAVFRDYGEAKTVPVLLTGSRARHYPWRNEVARALETAFDTTSTPHFGWNSREAARAMVQGERYARLINASVFVPTCGTMARDVVRKHLEVPGARSCLVTERTAAIEALGFEDMVSCVFAEAGDVVDRLHALQEDPETLQRIVDAGHRLVHEHHTTAHRDQLAQWFGIVSEHGTGVRVDQSWPDGRLTPSAGERPAGRIPVGGRDRALLADGWAQLRAGDRAGAERSFRRAANFFAIPETQIALAHAALLAGDVPAAGAALTRVHIPVLSHHRAPHPDPVQWAYELRLQLCAGDDGLAAAAALAHPDLGGVELDRMRRAAARILGVAVPPPGPLTRSAMPVPETPEEEWTAELAAMLRACGQEASAARLTGSATARPGAARPATARLRRRVRMLAAGHTRPLPIRWARARLAPLRRAVTADEWGDLLAELAGFEPVDAILVPGGEGSRAAAALAAGAATNTRLPEVVTGAGEAPAGDVLVVLPAGAPLPADAVLASAAAILLERPDAALERRLAASHTRSDTAGHPLLRRVAVLAGAAPGKE